MCFPVIFTKQNPWILYTARKLEDIGQHIPRQLWWPSWKVLKLECTRCYFLSCRKSLIYLKQKMFWYFLIFCHHSHTSLLDSAKGISFFYSFFVVHSVELSIQGDSLFLKEKHSLLQRCFKYLLLLSLLFSPGLFAFIVSVLHTLLTW